MWYVQEVTLTGTVRVDLIEMRFEFRFWKNMRNFAKRIFEKESAREEILR